MKTSAEEEQDDRRYVAIAASVLRPCANHSEVVIFVEGADVRDAYRLGEKMLKAGQLKAFFKSQR